MVGETAKGETRIQELSAAQRAIARRAAEARATVPDVELHAEIEMSNCLALRSELGCSLTSMLVRSFALALRDVPRANGAYRDGRFELHSRVNVGVVVCTDDAYLIPTVFDADSKSVSTLSEEVGALVDGARGGSLPPPALSGATFTLANTGRSGIASGAIVVGQSQAAAASAGVIRQVPVVREGAIVPGQSMTVTLACDHRILYGAEAARFLTVVKSRLEGAEL